MVSGKPTTAVDGGCDSGRVGRNVGIGTHNSNANRPKFPDIKESFT